MIKFLLFILLFGLIVCQCALIYYIGGYNPSNNLTTLLNDFDAEMSNFLVLMVAVCQFPLIWLLPNFNLIIGSWLIVKEKYLLSVIAMLFALMILLVLAWAMYSPRIFMHSVI